MAALYSFGWGIMANCDCIIPRCDIGLGMMRLGAVSNFLQHQLMARLDDGKGGSWRQCCLRDCSFKSIPYFYLERNLLWEESAELERDISGGELGWVGHLIEERENQMDAFNLNKSNHGVTRGEDSDKVESYNQVVGPSVKEKGMEPLELDSVLTVDVNSRETATDPGLLNILDHVEGPSVELGQENEPSTGSRGESVQAGLLVKPRKSVSPQAIQKVVNGLTWGRNKLGLGLEKEGQLSSQLEAFLEGAQGERVSHVGQTKPVEKFKIVFPRKQGRGESENLATDSSAYSRNPETLACGAGEHTKPQEFESCGDGKTTNSNSSRRGTSCSVLVESSLEIRKITERAAIRREENNNKDDVGGTEGDARTVNNGTRCTQRTGVGVETERANSDSELEDNIVQDVSEAVAGFCLEFPNEKEVTRSSKAFVMRVSDDEDTGIEDEENNNPNLVVGKRFSCEDMYVSDTDSSEDELALEEIQGLLMEPVGLLEGVLSEREIEHQQWVEEEIRHIIALLEMDLMNENERSTSALFHLEKLIEAKRDMDRKLDTQYRWKIAEALDNHLIAIQRNHEHKSQIEERKIRSDAAFEEAKRKERALQVEKVRQEKARAEAEVRERKAEEERKEALEAERRITKEAAEKIANETTVAYGEAGQKDIAREADGSVDESKEIKDKVTMIRGSERAIKIEAERLQKYNELAEKNQALGLSSNQNFRQYELQIGRLIRQIPGTRENVRTKANELIKIMNNPLCPQSISIATFAKKVVFQSETLRLHDNTAFACGHVMVLVTSQVPAAMDILLAEFHKVCIYTVPKYVIKSKSGLEKDAYLKLLGYREEDGKIETREQYLGRMESCMKLYGALVQTETDGARNLHGLEEGWAWLARFLNALPANIYTAVALDAFLKMAGYALFRRYKSQFRKILNLITANFVTALEAINDPGLNSVIINIKTYINTNQYLKEPEGWRLQTSLLSVRGVVDESGYHHQNQYYNQQYGW